MVTLPEYRYCNNHGEPKPCIYCYYAKRGVKPTSGASHNVRQQNRVFNHAKIQRKWNA